MSIFISWSSDQSRMLAEALEKLLESTIPELKERQQVFVSRDIEKGAQWFASIVDHLRNAKVGIVCLTPESLKSPWLHFEAGALAMRVGMVSKGKESPDFRTRLFTVLHRVSSAELKGPLSAYQSTTTTELEMGALVRSVAELLEDRPDFPKTPVISKEAWETFERALDNSAVRVADLILNLELMFQRKTFTEPLHHCADQAWLRRYQGARTTYELLSENRSRVQAVCSLHERGLFEMLLKELDGYAMAIQSQLLEKPREFELQDNGELKIDLPTKTCCEDRRLAIRSLAGRLLHPLDQPLREEAVRFMAAETHEERKMIIHRLEGEIRRQRELAYEDPSMLDGALECLTRNQSPIDFRQSSWDLDRIFYYLLIQYFEFHAVRWKPQSGDAAGKSFPPGNDAKATPGRDDEWSCAARDVELEIERFNAKSKGGSLIPLTYALVALQAIEPQKARPGARSRLLVIAALDLVRREMGRLKARQAGLSGSIATSIDPIERLLDDLTSEMTQGSPRRSGFQGYRRAGPPPGPVQRPVRRRVARQ